MTVRGIRKKMEGVVVSDKMDKTAVVMVNRLVKHKIYGKFVRKHTKYMAHDPQNRCHLGDKVTMIESRPLSKKKRWHIIDIVETSGE